MLVYQRVLQATITFFDYEGRFWMIPPILCKSIKTWHLQPAKHGNVMGCSQKGIISKDCVWAIGMAPFL